MFLESWGELRSLMIPLSYVGQENIFYIYVLVFLNMNLMVLVDIIVYKRNQLGLLHLRRYLLNTTFMILFLNIGCIEKKEINGFRGFYLDDMVRKYG